MRVPLLSKTDFDCVVQVARHCDWNTLKHYIIQVEETDLRELLCDFYDEFVNNIEDYQDLFQRHQFTKDGFNSSHEGIKRVLIHLAYGEYLLMSSNIDTGFGVVKNDTDFSIPTPLNELKHLRKHHRELAYKYWKSIREYICLNESRFNGICKCGGCETSKSINSNFKIISKYD